MTARLADAVGRPGRSGSAAVRARLPSRRSPRRRPCTGSPVHFLLVGAAHGAAVGLYDEGHDRDVVEFGVVQPVRQVDRAEAGGRRAHAHRAGELGVADGLEGGRLLVPRLHELGRLSARPQAASSPLMPSPTYAKTWPTSRSRRPWRTWSDTFVSAVGTSVPASADASARGEGGTTMHGSPALAPSRSTTRRPASQRPVEASRLRPFRPHWGRIGRWPVACPAWMVTVGSALSCWSAPPCRRDASARPRRQPTSAWEEPVPPRARWRSSECFPRPFVTRPVHLLCRLPRATTHRSVRSGLRPHGGRWSALR